MKYLSLERNELKELIFLRIGSFTFGTAIVLLSAIVIGLVAFQFHIPSALIYAAVLSTLIGGSLIVMYTNKDYISDLKNKEKKVYKGVLSQKKSIVRNKRKRYVFNVDGFIFLVDEDSFSKYSEGELLELHISPSVKHLFKIERIAA